MPPSRWRWASPRRSPSTPNRGRLGLVAVVVAVPAAAAAVLVARSHDLTNAPSSLAVAAQQGHRLAAALLVLAALALLAPAVVDAASPRLPRLPRLGPRAAFAAAAVVVAAGLLAALAVTLGGKAYDAFPLGRRRGSARAAYALTCSASRGTTRTTYWRVALDDFRDHPVLGSGAGTYDLRWTHDRPFGAGARDAHSLYVETLAELGPLGLALLVGALGAPFLALRSARERPLVPALAGAYAV